MQTQQHDRRFERYWQLPGFVYGDNISLHAFDMD